MYIMLVHRTNKLKGYKFIIEIKINYCISHYQHD